MSYLDCRQVAPCLHGNLGNIAELEAERALVALPDFKSGVRKAAGGFDSHALPPSLSVFIYVPEYILANQ